MSETTSGSDIKVIPACRYAHAGYRCNEQGRNRMRKSIIIAAALALAAFMLQPSGHNKVFAQSGPFYINAVDIDVVPGQIDAYLAALKENGAAAVHEPGCHEFNITVSPKD